MSTPAMKALMRTIRPKDVEEWLKNDTVNPKTGASIKKDGPTYTAFRLKHEQFSQKKAEEDAILAPEQEEEPLDRREAALRAFIDNEVSRGRVRNAAKLATANRAMLEKYRAVQPAATAAAAASTSQPANAPPAAVMTEQTIGAYVSPYLVHKGAPVAMNADVRAYMVKTLNTIVRDVRKMANWKKAPKHPDKYIIHRLAKIVKPSFIFRTGAFIGARHYGGIILDKAITRIEQAKRGEYQSPLVKNIVAHYDVTDEVASVIGCYADSAIEVVLQVAIDHHAYRHGANQPFILTMFDIE